MAKGLPDTAVTMTEALEPLVGIVFSHSRIVSAIAPSQQTAVEHFLIVWLGDLDSNQD
jgi:hypothetical protein